MDRRTFLLGATGAVAVAGLPWTSRIALAGPVVCDPFETPPSFTGLVPSPNDVLGFDLGSQEVTSAESAAYIDAVAAASDRVITGTYGTSVQGRDLRYAIVGKPENVTPPGLDAITDAIGELRDPLTSEMDAAALADTTPAILWVIANAHGGEESGADAALQVLYELADRDDCVAEQILDHAIVVLIPIQNPDGREADTRRNAYGFDLNRDMFARTQPESDGKVELMRTYPPTVLLDSHEFGYYQSFFPPNNDPIYHEVTDQALEEIHDAYGPAMSAEFRERGWGFFHGKVYDFFSPEFNDTVATNGFLGTGMTIEVHQDKAIDQRFIRHYVVDMTVLFNATERTPAILRAFAESAREALAEGINGKLEPNARIFNPRKPVRTPVPKRRVRHYFVRDVPSKARERDLLIRRLQRMDVEVQVLDAPLDVPDFIPYGRAPRAVTLPAGTLWITMAQAQKHWIQMMLNEDPYLPTIYTFGLSGWSVPLLMNLDGGSSGAIMNPSASVVGPVAEPGPPILPGPQPSIGVYRLSGGSFADESVGATKWLLDGWGITYTDLESDDIAAGGLAGIDVLVTPGGGAFPAMRRLGAGGRAALVEWVEGGGRYIGYRYGGARLAVELGMTRVTVTKPKSEIDGSLVRAKVDTSSPLADGVGPFVSILYSHDLVLHAHGANAPVHYPGGRSRDFFISGYAKHEEDLFGTAAVTDEFLGDGRVVLFSSDPAFEGIVDGTERVLFNAIFGEDPAESSAPRMEHALEVAGATDLPPFDAWMRLSVARSDAAGTRRLLSAHGAEFVESGGSDLTRFFIDNPDELTLEEHPWAIGLLQELRRAGVQIQAFSDH